MLAWGSPSSPSVFLLGARVIGVCPFTRLRIILLRVCVQFAGMLSCQALSLALFSLEINSVLEP